jgi:hypothetical protein
VLLFVGEIYCVLFSGEVVWLGVVLGGFIVGIVMCECEGGVIIWFGWAVIGMNCGVVGVFVCRVGVVVGVVGEGRVKKV